MFVSSDIPVAAFGEGNGCKKRLMKLPVAAFGEGNVSLGVQWSGQRYSLQYHTRVSMW
jgi:hypothetical protein